MKQLILKKIESKNGQKFKYAVVEIIDGQQKVLCTRTSARDYVACYVKEITERWDDDARKAVKLNQPKYDAPYYFGRIDLIGKGDSRFLTASDVYGLAILEGMNHTPPQPGN